MEQKSIIKFFWRHIKPYYGYYIVMLIAPIIGSFYGVATQYAVKSIVDIMTKPFDLHQTILPVIIFVGAQLVLQLVWRISNIAEWQSEPHVRESITTEAFDYVQHQPYPFFQNHHTGALISKLKGILDGYDHFWAAMHHGVLFNILIVFVNIIALIWVNHTLGFFMFGWGIFFTIIFSHLSKKLNHLSFVETESRHGIIAQMADRITNIQTVLSFAKRASEKLALHHYFQKDFIPKQVTTYQYDSKIQLVSGLAYLIMLTFTFIFAIHLRMINTITIGDFSFVLTLTLGIADNLWQSMVRLQDFARVMGDLRSALSIIYTPHPARQVAYNDLTITNPTIYIRDLSFSYTPENPVFKHLNLTIKPGEKVGLVGHTGAGKSTLIQLLLRHFTSSEGNIYFDQYPISDLHEDVVRRHIALIPQDPMLFHKTLRENLCYNNPEMDEETMINACKHAHLHHFIISLPDGYDTMVGERGIKLSGGQRQRVAIARAILKKAPILILDEATSSLDSETEAVIQRSLIKLMQERHTTVIAIAHRLSTLKHMDRIIVLDQGRIMEEGDHETLMRKSHSLYKKLWDHQKI